MHSRHAMHPMHTVPVPMPMPTGGHIFSLSLAGVGPGRTGCAPDLGVKQRQSYVGCGQGAF
ncbi:MAG TPA: hypothetical protein PKN86_14430 [Candidatus Obscuribacter sp.]|nr:hypothetical protein [Candidatus Obscuribacter sp.]HNM50909.1 hypothetical protein [Candidatus Obscuribacter sp.]